MANPRRPTALKVISGTSRKDRDAKAAPTLPAVAGVPDPPDWLPNPQAVEEFNRLASILFSNGLLTEGAVSSLGHLAALHGTIVKQWRVGICPSGHLLAQYRALIGDFGLTPAAAFKVKPGGSNPKPNKFASNGKRQK